MAETQGVIEKIRSKEWSEPLGKVLGVSASIADKLSSAGVPFTGIVAGALKLSTSVLNPNPSLSDLKRMQQELEKQMTHSTGVVKRALAKELESIKEDMQKPQTELIEDIHVIKKELQNTAAELAKDMATVEEDLQLTKEIVLRTYNLVVDIRYKDGVERIDGAFKVFVKGARNLETTFSEMKGFLFEMQTVAEQSFAPEKIRGYLKAMKVTNDVNICQNVAQYIVITQSKYLQIMAAYFLFNKDFDRATDQFKLFNEQYKTVCAAFKEEFNCDFKPHARPNFESVKKLAEAEANNFKASNSMERNPKQVQVGHKDISSSDGRNEGLWMLLQRMDCLNLYQMFEEHEVTEDVLWKLKKENLDQMGVKIGSQIKFFDARNKYESNLSKSWFFIKSMHSGLVLDIEGRAHGANIITNPQKKARQNHGRNSQLWKWNGSSIVSQMGYALEVKGEHKYGQMKGTYVIAGSNHGGRNQQFSMKGNKIFSEFNGLCLDIYGGSYDSGIQILTWPMKPGEVNNQSWELEYE